MAGECILVGNGTSVLDAQHGARIDRFSTVVRFNQFHLGKLFAHHVGSRTDIWFTVLPPVNATWRIQQPLRRLYVHTWVADPEEDKTFQAFQAMPLPFPVFKVDHGIVTEMCAYADESYQPWSTGALAIWLMLKEFGQVFITGFDWWERDAHHYGDKAVRGKLHQPMVEKRLIDKLQGEGRLSFL